MRRLPAETAGRLLTSLRPRVHVRPLRGQGHDVPALPLQRRRAARCFRVERRLASVGSAHTLLGFRASRATCRGQNNRFPEGY